MGLTCTYYKYRSVTIRMLLSSYHHLPTSSSPPASTGSRRLVEVSYLFIVSLTVSDIIDSYSRFQPALRLAFSLSLQSSYASFRLSLHVSIRWHSLSYSLNSTGNTEDSLLLPLYALRRIFLSRPHRLLVPRDVSF